MFEVIGVALLALLASAVGTLTGFGTSTIMVPVLLLFLPLGETLLLVGVIHFFGDIWKMVLFRKGFSRWKLILAFGVPGILFSYLGATLSFQIPEALLSRTLGAVLLGYVGFLFWKRSFKLPENQATAVIGGSLSGVMAGIFGIGGAVRSAFLSAFNLPKSVYLVASGAIAFFIDITRLTTYVVGGTRLPSLYLYGLFLFIPVSFLGAKIAERLLKRIPEKSFRLVVAGFLLIVGMKLFLFP